MRDFAIGEEDAVIALAIVQKPPAVTSMLPFDKGYAIFAAPHPCSPRYPERENDSKEHYGHNLRYLSRCSGHLNQAAVAYDTEAD